MINGMDDMSWTSTSCWGHNEEDVTVWHEDIDSENDKRYTNAELMVLFDPTNSSVPYVYADFEWSHCAEEGYPSDLMIPTSRSTPAPPRRARPAGTRASPAAARATPRAMTTTRRTTTLTPSPPSLRVSPRRAASRRLARGGEQ